MNVDRLSGHDFKLGFNLLSTLLLELWFLCGYKLLAGSLEVIAKSGLHAS